MRSFQATELQRCTEDTFDGGSTARYTAISANTHAGQRITLILLVVKQSASISESWIWKI
jgi:hypothetical protein